MGGYLNQLEIHQGITTQFYSVASGALSPRCEWVFVKLCLNFAYNAIIILKFPDNAPIMLRNASICFLPNVRV